MNITIETPRKQVKNYFLDFIGIKKKQKIRIHEKRTEKKEKVKNIKRDDKI